MRRNAGNAEVAFSRNEVLTERINIIGTAFLGLTLGCARCHDHMFDPIRQTDYYRMQAFLASTYERDIQIAAPRAKDEWQQQTDVVNAQIAKLKKRLEQASTDEAQRIGKEIKSAEAKLPPALPTISTVRVDEQQLTPIHLLDRGDPSKKKQPLGMRPLGVLLPSGAPQHGAETADSKTLLAEWISSPSNPLTARVLVNRLWQYHFGRGIVGTANDFGDNGDAPTHPKLLDFLAAELMRGGWRIKPIHRLIVLSSTYRQASHSPAAEQAAAVDPDNRLLWRQNRRRLAAQEIRDAMLVVSGAVDRQVGGPSLMLPVEQELIDLLYKPEQWQVAGDVKQHNRRSIYLVAKRNLRLPFMEVFDQPDLADELFAPRSEHPCPAGAGDAQRRAFESPG